MDAVWSAVQAILGLEEMDLNAAQMALRAIIVYVVTLVLVRLGKKRFLGQITAFDTVVGIILGSIVSRAITGNSPFFPTMVAATVVVVLHWAFSAAAVRSDRFGTLVKGQNRLLVDDGEILWENMKKSNITEKDLRGGFRTAANTDDLARVKEARLERSGEISVVKAQSEPKVVEFLVENGVQTVRIKLQ